MKQTDVSQLTLLSVIIQYELHYLLFVQSILQIYIHHYHSHLAIPPVASLSDNHCAAMVVFP